MKRIPKIARFNLFLLSISVILVSSCSDKDGENMNNMARVIVTLVDSPADYKKVNVDIKEISLKTDGTMENEGWIRLTDLQPGVYNILDFTGGQELPLADMAFPAGTISQIKLKLGKNNTLSFEDHESTLLLANDYGEGFKFQVQESIEGGNTYYFRIDFDAARSVSMLGNTGQLLLKPAIRLMSPTTSGSVSGNIYPAEKNVLVNVIAANTIIASSYAPENTSRFFIPGLPAGTYDISFECSNNGFQLFTRDVRVVTGEVTELGDFNIREDQDD